MKCPDCGTETEPYWCSEPFQASRKYYRCTCGYCWHTTLLSTKCKECGSEDLVSKVTYVFGDPGLGVRDEWVECADCGARQ